MSKTIEPIAHRRTTAILLIWIAVVTCMALFSWSQRTRPDQKGVVRGQLVEWSEIHLSTGRKTLRFTISGSQDDFRIDSMTYNGVKRQQILNSLVRGANVEITADSKQIVSPQHPLLDRSAAIIWVHGLSVEGHNQFTVSDVIENEDRDRLWILPLIGFPLTFLAWHTLGRWRDRKHQVD